MSNLKDVPPYTILKTNDDSPSMRFGDGESMHSLEGALSETLYIYAPPLEKAAVSMGSIKALSVGLGLGYNEMLAAGLALKHSCDHVEILSFESEAWLVESFLNWLDGRSNPLALTYDEILHGIAKRIEVNAGSIKQSLVDLKSSGKLQLNSALTENFERSFRANAVLFDAFSFKTSPQLWSQEFIEAFLSFYADDTCYFSTYAATGNLHRSLKSKGFRVEKIKGFGHKREATFAEKI